MKTLTLLSLVLAALGSAPIAAQDAMPGVTPPAPAEPAVPTGESTPPPVTGDVVTPPASTTEPEAADDAAPPSPAVPESAPPPPVTDPAVPAAPDATPAPMPTPAQSMTPDQKAAYDRWPANVRGYFDGLPASRQMLFQRIQDADKVRLAGLPADQQETVWASLEKQDAEQRSEAPAKSEPQ